MPFPQAERNVNPEGSGVTFNPYGPPGARPGPPRPVAQLPPTQLSPGFANRNLPQSTLDAFARFAAAEAATMQPPSRKQKRKAKGRGLLKAIAVLVVLAAAGGAAYHFRDKIFPQPAASHPKAWDPRVAPMVSFVEQARELRFEHPIYVDFLTEADFVALFDQPPSSIDTEVQQQAQQASALYNAQTLAVGYDPLAGQQTVSSVATLGFYSPDDQRIFVRGDVLTPGVRTTLAHELTHALQDQHFDLSLGGEDDLELRAIVEADAMRIEDKYVATMTPEEQAAGTADNTMSAEEEAALGTVPAAIVESTYAPYELGPALLEAAVAAKGNAGADELIASPPPEMVLLDPSLYGTAVVDEEIEVAIPDGATIIEPSQRLSALQLLFMLDAWLPWDMARGALDGWTGGGYASFQRPDGTVCFSAVAQFASPPEPMNTAVTWWAGAAGSTAVPLMDGNRVSFTACDRGPGAAAPPGQELSTLTSLDFEAFWVRENITAMNDHGDVRSLAAKRLISICEARALASDPAVVTLLAQGSVPPEQEQLVNGVRANADANCAVPLGI